MTRRTGFAQLPLHSGRAPAWLFSRMTRLARQVSIHIVADQGPAELLRRLSDPFWFQAFGCVLGFDWGALALGGALGTIAVITRQEIVLSIMGGIFVVEALSVMAQVSWFKFTKKRFGEGRRILKMAPLHHHFEKSGWTETQVVVRFWIITMLLCLIGLASLKLR